MKDGLVGVKSRVGRKPQARQHRARELDPRLRSGGDEIPVDHGSLVDVATRTRVAGRCEILARCAGVARADRSSRHVFNRRGSRMVLELAGWVAEVTTPVPRDQAGPGVGSRERALRRPMHALGVRGRSAANRARPLR
jgi:hypothetical protein